MTYSIFWTPEAERTFYQNLDYLAKEWNAQVINAFLDRVEEVLKQVGTNPLLFPVYKEMEMVHKCILNERMTLIFRIVDQDAIHLLTFWNTYQDPKQFRI